MDISGSKTQNQVARLHNSPNLAVQNVAFWHIKGSRMPMVQQSRHDCVSGDPRDGRFACGINVRHKDEIRPIKSRSELLLERLCACVAMRLKHHDEPLMLKRARGLKRRLDFGGMMTVVVHHRVSLGLQLDFKSSLGA